MGEEVAQFLVTATCTTVRNEVLSFLQHVQLFYIEAVAQIKSSFPINDPILKALTFLNPDVINSTNVSEVTNLAAKFPNIILEDKLHKTDHEWRELQFLDPNDLPSTSNITSRRRDVVSFWGSIG